MTAYRTITCPACRFSRAMPAASVPAEEITVTCPQCGASFSLDGSDAAPVSTVQEQTVLSFRFNGTAREYFGIWIVNTLLKIVTFGIYSAWAKVRKRRWFYGNTTLAASPFDYLADPKALFKGWLIGVGVLAVYSAAGKIDPLLAFIAGALLYLGIPWVIVRSRIFNSRNSSHRNIRFAFRPNYREAYLVYVGLLLLSVLTLGLAFPYAIYRQRRFQVENSSFGTSPFRLDARPWDFYRAYLGGGLWFALIVVAVLMGLFMVLQGGPAFKNPRDLQLLLGPMILILYIGMLVLTLVFTVYMKVRLANLTWNGTCLGSGRFVSSLRIGDLLWLYISNLVAIALSLGLMIPWASVRLARYRCAHLQFVHDGPLDAFLAQAQGVEAGAAGEELAEMFDAGVELGL